MPPPESSGSASARAERLFLAVDLSRESRIELAAALRSMSLPGRPVPAGNLHLTLRFLGDTGPKTRDRLISRLGAAELGDAFELTLSGAGAFPKPARATTLWIGTAAGTAELRALAERAESAVRSAGLPLEPRSFRGHLTVSRFRAPEDARPILGRLSSIAVRTPVTEVVLFRSTLGQGPPQYQALARFPLRGLARQSQR